jgi:Type II secretion system (T2SS), protein M
MKQWKQMRSRDRRALTFGGSILLAAFAFTFGVQPYRQSHAALEERVAEQRTLLARELSVLGTADELPAAVRDATHDLDGQRLRLLPGRDPLAATAALVGLVGEEARRQGVALEAIESRAAEPAGEGLVGVRIEVRGRTDLEGLLRWLGRLENGPVLVRIEGMTVARSDAGAEPDSADTESLLLAAVIRGYVLPEAAVSP